MRVLVVEDEPDLRRGLCQALREEGYAVDSTGDGAEGLYKAKAWQYDAIVLDLMLPTLNGLDILEQLRAEKTTPTLILTARDGVDDRVRGLDQGADDYLVKPFELSELLARLRALIRRSSGQATSEITVGNVQIDTAAKVVCLGGSPVSLTAREFSLVELLVLQRGKVVSRTAMYDHLFDETHDSLSNLLDVYISRVRNKLGKQFISTRRGQGYIVND